MNVILSHEHPCSYSLTPANKKLAARQKKNTGEESILFQTDWDFPGLARSLGWRGKIGRERCGHHGTDGTVACPDCGRTAGQFIAAARAWLDDRCGTIMRPYGIDAYFNLDKDELPGRKFTAADITDSGRIFTVPAELVSAPLWYHEQGLQQTASGYGAKLTTSHKINYNGKLYRIYCTCYGNSGSCWFKVNGKKIYVD